jgi:tryptophan halogenase
MSENIKKVVIVGGGTAGWMAAAALSKVFDTIDITLIESDQIGTIGVGEATIPTMLFFNRIVGIDENEFLKQSQGTYKLGINFENWHENGKEYFHAFGSTGTNFWAAGFHNFWRRGLNENISAEFGHYNFETQAAKAGRFAKTPQDGLNYAFHLDASLYAKMLRDISENRGVKRIEGKITHVNLNSETGHIDSVQVDGATSISGELFLDCSGFKALLIEEALHTGFDDWSHWLPCNRAIAVQTENTEPPVPYTRAIAHTAGWRWQIPLQHRVGNGVVFSSEYMSEDEATGLLLRSVDGKTLTDPRTITFKTGRRKKQWNKNCIAIGLAGGFIEPLESTAIHLIQQNILKLIKLFPSNEINLLNVDEYNKDSEFDYDQIKDFIVLHYHLTKREDSPFWRHCKTMEIPESLKQRLHLFEETGNLFLRMNELFVDSWLQVMIGQGLIPKKYHRVVDEMSSIELKNFLDHIQGNIQGKLASLPSHDNYLKQ